MTFLINVWVDTRRALFWNNGVAVVARGCGTNGGR